MELESSLYSGIKFFKYHNLQSVFQILHMMYVLHIHQPMKFYFYLYAIDKKLRLRGAKCFASKFGGRI